MSNPFHIKPEGPKPGTHPAAAPPFFQQQVKAEQLREQARNMTRQELFNNGLLTVEDMDDEELRCGRMRGPDGKIPRVNKTMDSIPRDLYDAMVQEHNTRTQEKYREQMDLALNTIIEIMIDPANEPRDRLEAAKHIKEQVMGKTPDKVQLAVAKAPWEEMFGDFANITRAEHAARQRRLEAGVIDAEVVDESQVPQDADGTEVRGARQTQPTHAGSKAQPVGPRRVIAEPVPANAQPDQPGQRLGEPGYANSPSGDPSIRYPAVAPHHAQPASSSSVATATNSELVRWASCDQQDLAARRAAARERIAVRKKQRIIKRTLGVMPNAATTVATQEVPNADDPSTGKLRHTFG